MSTARGLRGVNGTRETTSRGRRSALRLAGCGLFAVVVACGRGTAPADGDPPAAAAAATEAPTPALTPGGAERVPPREARHFDPADVSVGDTVLGLRVVLMDVERVFEDSVWSGSAGFTGEITLTGTYRQHFDYPEIDAVCFWMTDPASIARIPEFAPDTWTSPNQRAWFCFTNPDEARAALGSGAEPRVATVVVDDYTNHRIFSDVFDTARLVRVIEVDVTPQAP